MSARPRPLPVRPSLAALLLAALAPALCAPTARAAVVLPDGFEDQLVVSGLTLPVGMAFLPDGRLLVVEQRSGRIVLVRDGAPATAVSAGIVPDVNTAGTERGLLGIAVDPGWPARPYVYVHVTDAGGTIKISRFRASGDLGNQEDGLIAVDPLSRYDLIDDIPDAADNHNGGTVRFGPDGMLYASLGEDAVPRAAQDTSSLRGVILRLDVSRLPDGAGTATREMVTPPDNPFVATNGPDGRLIWAFGLRNPFRFQIDAHDGRLYIADVGLSTWEEIDVATAGGMNFGWPKYEGNELRDPGSPEPTPSTGPIYVLNHDTTGAASVMSAGVYRRPAGGTRSFPADYQGDFFLGDYYAGFLRRLVRSGSSWDLAAPVPGQPTPENWATGLAAVSDFAIGPEGGLWYCRQYEGPFLETGQVRRIVSATVTSRPARDEAARAVRFATPYPVPSRGHVDFDYDLPAPARVALSIHDLQGRRVRELFGARLESSGRHHASWDGLDRSARPVRSGLYLVRLTVDHRDYERHVLVIR